MADDSSVVDNKSPSPDGQTSSSSSQPPNSQRRQSSSPQSSSSSASPKSAGSSPSSNGPSPTHHRRSSTPNGLSGSYFFNRTSQSVITSLNQWLTDLGTNPINVLLSSITSPFRRRQSSPCQSPQAVRRSKSEIYKNAFGDDSEDYSESSVFDRPLAGFLNSPVPTAKGIDLIELTRFGVIEVENLEKGVGHKFEPHQWTHPTWCDSCGDFLWTPVNFDNCVNPSSHFQAVSCANCRYTCHVRCRRLVRIDCQGLKETGTLVKNVQDDARRKMGVSPLPERSVLERKIILYNARLKNKGSGLGISLLDSGNFRGFIRVHLNLTRPINVVAGTRPPSIYDIIKEDDESANVCRRTLTSFYMPRDTVKNIHITSESTSLEVIRSMLKKFKVVDNPQKFALYQCFPDPDQEGKTLLKRIGDSDRPLRIALDWLDSDDKKFVLQENDTGDIAWEAFALPELNNFLVILQKEEEEHVHQVILKYRALKEELARVAGLKVKMAEERQASIGQEVTV